MHQKLHVGVCIVGVIFMLIMTLAAIFTSVDLIKDVVNPKPVEIGPYSPIAIDPLDKIDLPHGDLTIVGPYRFQIRNLVTKEVINSIRISIDDKNQAQFRIINPPAGLYRVYMNHVIVYSATPITVTTEYDLLDKIIYVVLIIALAIFCWVLLFALTILAVCKINDAISISS